MEDCTSSPQMQRQGERQGKQRSRGNCPTIRLKMQVPEQDVSKKEGRRGLASFRVPPNRSEVGAPLSGVANQSHPRLPGSEEVFMVLGGRTERAEWASGG
uniref:Uncharacterized protein n=1 Tax=Eutreptiella gymnastica TaxID=73025 RepID=A0A7S1HVY4_9EUGL